MEASHAFRLYWMEGGHRSVVYLPEWTLDVSLVYESWIRSSRPPVFWLLMNARDFERLEKILTDVERCCTIQKSRVDCMSGAFLLEVRPQFLDRGGEQGTAAGSIDRRLSPAASRPASIDTGRPSAR